MNLENKIALITGSTRGIGKSIAKLFAKNNATVIICGRNIESSKKTIEELDYEKNKLIGTIKHFKRCIMWSYYSKCSS